MSSHPMTQLGGKAFNHSSSSDAEAEYDRLRGLARGEAAKRGACFDKAHQAYERGDGAAAHDLSTEGKAHASKMDEYNKQASDYIFRENNSTSRIPSDTIDLHGQYVSEAEEILEKRIRYAQSTGQTHLHVIVGKGNHSKDHVQKIKPKVEQVCGELGLKFVTEENAGVMYINLQGGEAVMPPPGGGGGRNTGGEPYVIPPQSGHQQPSGGQQNAPYQGQPQQQQPQQGDNENQNDEVEKLIKKFMPKVMRKLEGCCVVM